jgi:hypothetical protein
MTENPSDPTSTPRRNLRLGLIIGGLCLAQVVVFIIIFSRTGLPKDPKVWKEQQARQAAQQAQKDSHE